MKKTFLALLLLGSSIALFAQTDTTGDAPKDTTGGRTDTTANMNSGNTAMDDGATNNPSSDASVSSQGDNPNMSRSATGSYSAYGPVTNVPVTIQTSFQNQYPGASDARWEQSNDWYRVYYKNGEQDMSMYYDARGQGFMMALPVVQNLVPGDVVAKVKDKYGNNAYDILSIKDANEEDVYQVRIAENGEMRTETINASGETVTDIYRTESDEAVDGMNNNSMDNNTAPNATFDKEPGVSTEMNTTPATGNPTGVNENTTPPAPDATDNTNTEPNVNSEMNNNTATEGKRDTDEEIKIKAKTRDGKETKIKAEDGEIKVKQDD